MRRQRKTLVLALGMAALSAGCEVTNPGPVADEYLSVPASQEGLIRGSQERLTRAVGVMAYTGPALAAREIFPGGQTGSYGYSVAEQAGQYGTTDWSASGEYNNAQQARWIAEEAIRKFTERGDVAPVMMAEAHIWAGFANRVLGEHWCEAVIDGGALQPGKAYFERAQEHFTKALGLAANANQTMVARAGRAQVRVWLEDWPGAAADAAAVPNSFVQWLEMDFTAGGNTSQRNHVYWASANTPYRSFTVRFTYYDTYYAETGDPRTPWKEYPTASARNCSASLTGFGAVPCTQQLKYRSQDDNMRLASGAEMRLIEAEALLVAGKWQEALAKINALRTSYRSDKTGQPLVPWSANSLDQTWTLLKRERGIELWLEARRAPDQRRWEPILGQQKTPGNLELPNFEARSSVFRTYLRGRSLTQNATTPRALCYNISNRERNNNPNIPDVADDGS